MYGLLHNTGQQEWVIENGLSAWAGQDGGRNTKNGIHILFLLVACMAKRMKTTNEKGGVDNRG